ncbi:MAG: DUF2339 domain-containing protein, partial [Planctomycetota bacterium]|nr:DUF2339 domain-containing protein [Planctomycetota bacterium]
LRTNLLANGDGAPLPFAPLFNPLDVGLGLALCWAMLWAKRQEAKALIAAPPLVFLWINGMLARSVAHYAQVDWDPDALWDSDAMQVTVSVAWTLLGLGTVLWATRNRHRMVWFVGAALLAVVVGKLFLVDLEHLNTVIKIVTFLVVGVLLLVVGFFSPMPPADPVSTDSNEELPEMEESP